jgi:hypothetical protein
MAVQMRGGYRANKTSKINEIGRFWGRTTSNAHVVFNTLYLLEIKAIIALIRNYYFPTRI